jgi:hypothetical protein
MLVPMGIEPEYLITGSKRVDHWTSGTVCQCSDIAGSGQYNKSFYSNSTEKIMFSACMYIYDFVNERKKFG